MPASCGCGRGAPGPPGTPALLRQPPQAAPAPAGLQPLHHAAARAGLGPWSQGLHLVSWGAASLRPPQALDATLCIPGALFLYVTNRFI